MYKIQVRETDTEEIKNLIRQANKIQSEHAMEGPSLHKHSLSVQFSKLQQKIDSLRLQQMQ